jgi:HEAT repeat protein
VTDEGTFKNLFSSDAEEQRLQALKSLVHCDKGSYPRSLYRAFGDESWRIRKEAAELFVSSAQAADLGGEIIGFLYADDNAGLRNTAFEILVALGHTIVPLLVKEADSSDHDVRKFVLDILGEIGDPATSAVMIGALFDPDKNVRAAAAENLGKIRAQEAIPHLLLVLNEPDLSLRFTVLDALGRIGADTPVDQLLPLGREKVLRKALFDCLGHLGAATALPVLVEGLTDQIRNVREAAALALDRICVHHWQDVRKILAETAERAVFDSLSALLESSRSEVRTAAVKLMGISGEGRFVPRILSLAFETETKEVAVDALVHLARSSLFSLTSLWHESDLRTRTCLAFVLGQASCGNVEELLLEGLGSADMELRSASAQALGRVGGAPSIARLAHCLSDPMPEVREAVQFALSSLGSRHPRETLIALRPVVQADSPEERKLAVLALSNVHSEEVDQVLGLAMKDESSMVRQAAIRALNGRADCHHLPALILALTDEDSEVRQQAVHILGSIPDPKALQALQSALRDEDLWVRTCAVRSLGRFGGRQAAEAVVGAIDDSVGLVTIAALEVLARLDRRDAQQYLEQALRHCDEEVVNAALHLLVQSGNGDWISAVHSDLINHQHWDVRVTYARALGELIGPRCRATLEGRLRVEEDDLVRQRLREILDGFSGVPGGEP